jgi:hypothetical protein
MPKLPSRTQPLTNAEQWHLVDQAIPGRLALIEAAFAKTPTHDNLITAAILARSLAGFLGIGGDRNSLWPDVTYHDHGGKLSYEVKINDFAGGVLFTAASLATLTAEDREALRVGFDTTNREFAHFTFWSDPINQQPSGAPNSFYIRDLAFRVSSFARTVIRLLRQRLNGL